MAPPLTSSRISGVFEVEKYKVIDHDNFLLMN